MKFPMLKGELSEVLEGMLAGKWGVRCLETIAGIVFIGGDAAMPLERLYLQGDHQVKDSGVRHLSNLQNRYHAG